MLLEKYFRKKTPLSYTSLPFLIHLFKFLKEFRKEASFWVMGLLLVHPDNFLLSMLVTVF